MEKVQARVKESRTLTGAWIETIKSLLGTMTDKVAPSRVRGLKPVLKGSLENILKVAPSRVRGLKLGIFHAITP